MPRKSKTQIAAEAAAAAAAARPFADESTAPYGAMPEDEARAVAEAVHADKVAGLSGDELRAKYGPRLSGPARRSLFRRFGLVGGIAPSYGAYRDGEARSGSRHAREHGARAAAQRAEAEAAQRAADEAEAKRAAAAAKRKAAAAAKRAATGKPAKVRGTRGARTR